MISPRLEEIRRWWQGIDLQTDADARDVAYLLTVAERAAALLDALQAPGVVIRVIDPNDFRQAIAARVALAELAEALGESQ